MTPLIVAIAVGLGAYLLFLVAFPKKPQTTVRTQHALRRIMEENDGLSEGLNGSGDDILKEDLGNHPGVRLMSRLPFGEKLASLTLKAGLEKHAGLVLLSMLGMAVLGGLALSTTKLGALGFLVASAAAVFVPVRYMRYRIRKRNGQFIHDFPDVLDMIVRSVRSGFPLSTAISMVAENMDPPVSTEFRQVAEELALGRSLDDALSRMAQRIDEPDIQFFVVVLKVQQETGGNLGEIISNLSNIIRKRKHLRQKIRAITSEGRITGWILAGIPTLVFIIFNLFMPDHVEPLYSTHTGNIMLLMVLGMILSTFVIVKNMLDIDI